MKKILYLFLSLFLCLNVQAAFWSVIEQNDTDTGNAINIAQIKNEDGYRIEIYKDQNDAVRLRFTSSNKHGLISSEHCPSFQVDNYKIFNRSINDANCIRHSKWAEFVLGYLTEETIQSTALYRIQNGNVLTFRYIMENDGYQQTSFSLSGSSRVILGVLGPETFIQKNR